MTSIPDIWGLEHQLDQKSPVRHKHTMREIDGLVEAFQLGHPEIVGDILISSIDGLSEALSAKAAVNHSHPTASAEADGFFSASDKAKLDALGSSDGGASTIEQIAGLQPELEGIQLAIEGKAELAHTHTIDEVTGLMIVLNSKAAASHTHAIATASSPGFLSASDKAKLDALGSSDGGASTIEQVEGLQAALANKAASDHTHAGLPALTLQQLPYTLSQSSTYQSTPPGSYETLTDGSLETGTGTNTDTTAWLKADLGSLRAVSEVWIAGGNISGGWGLSAGYLNGATLEFSRDDASWAMAIPIISLITDSTVTKFALSGGLARYVRIRRTGNYIGATEFRIFG